MASALLSMGENYVLPSSNSSKPLQYLIEVIGIDHGYAKPWSSQQRLPNPRPGKTLFSRDAKECFETIKSSGENQAKPAEEMLIIDVESVEDLNPSGPCAIKMQYDVSKSKISMGECERYVSSVSLSSKRTPDTWEELICRTGWTNQQNVLFDKILKIVSSYRLARLTYEGSANEPILCKVALDKATKKVRQIFSRVEWDSKLTTWLHSSMVDGLSIPLLGCYLEILQTLRAKVPSLVDQMIASPTSRRVSAGTTDNMTSLLKRPWDPTVGLSSFQRQRKVSGPPLLLIVPSGPTTNSSANATKRSRFWHQHMSNLGKVIPVTMHLSNSGRGVSIGQCLDHMIGAVQAKVLELKNHFPNRPVILIGWSTGALVSFQVSLAEPVCAVVCLGFPLLGLEGIRGENDDPFLQNKTPTMFVFGSLSNCCSLSDIEEFRKKLLAQTSLLVIGGADDQLRLTCAKKKIEGVTQSTVDRRIMDEIGEFLGNAVYAMNNDQNRSDYFDFDELDNRQKKPQGEKRKRPATNSTSSGEAAKKPKSKVTKPAIPKTQGNATKKPKSVKTVKRPAVSKPVVLPPGTTLVPGARPTAGIIPASIPTGIIGGVNVPVSGVNVPVTGCLGGRFVFSCPQPTGTTPSSNAQHLKVVMSSSPGTVTSVPGQQNMMVQYKTGVVTNPLSVRSPSSITTPATVRTVAPVTVSTNTATAAAKTAASAKTSSSMTTSSMSHNQQTSNSALITKRVVGAQGVLSTSNFRSTAVAPSTQAQFIMRKGELSMVNKQGTISSLSTTNSGQVKRGASPVQTKPQQISTTPSDSSVKQSVAHVNSLPVSSQTVAPLARRTPPVQTVTRTIQVGVADPKKPLLTKRTVTYSPSTSTKGINVVSRSGPTPSAVGMVARAAIPGSNVQTSVPATMRGYRAGVQINNVHDLSKQATSKPPTSTQLASAQSKSAQQAVTTLSLNAQLSNVQRSKAQLVSTSLISGNAQKPSTLSMSALTKSAPPTNTKSLATTSLSASQSSSSIPLYHNSDDEMLVEKIKGFVKDMVGSTPRYLKCDGKQTIVVSTKSTTSSALAAAVTTITKGEAQKKACEADKEKKSNDENGKK